VVQIYAETEVDGQLWYLIGPDEWAPGEYIARVDVNTTPLAGVDGDRWIEVNLHEQTLMVYDRRELVFATIIASGFDPFWTRPGLFQVYEKHDSTPMRGAFEADLSDAYYLEDVPWTMYFDDARALHGAYWRAKMGFEQSHGCVNLTVGDAHWIYDWAQVGDWVYVWDPSGQTPTDPSLYSSGGY
jgi:lipoprotein-anchoring transpeptidase ErfK/SrfK